jgi:hypothetical protein
MWYYAIAVSGTSYRSLYSAVLMVFSHQMPETAFAADVFGGPIVPTIGYFSDYCLSL